MFCITSFISSYLSVRISLLYMFPYTTVLSDPPSVHTRHVTPVLHPPPAYHSAMLWVCVLFALGFTPATVAIEATVCDCTHRPIWAFSNSRTRIAARKKVWRRLFQ